MRQQSKLHWSKVVCRPWAIVVYNVEPTLDQRRNAVWEVADQMANGSLEGLLDWVKVCVTNKPEVELHMLDRELLSAFCVFLGNLPRKEELSTLLGWRMVYSIMQVMASEGSTIGEGPSQSIYWRQGLAPFRSSSVCPGDV